MRGVGARAVAQAGMAFMLALCKVVPCWDRQLKAGNWKSRYEQQGTDLDGKTLGIVGFGRIGQILAEMARPFAMTVVTDDPYAPQARAAELGVELIEIDELMRRAGFISLYGPQTPQAQGLINCQRLTLVKPGTYLITLARGA